jgi:hypothetical protein
LAFGAAFLRAVRLVFLRSALSVMLFVFATLTSFASVCSALPLKANATFYRNRWEGGGKGALDTGSNIVAMIGKLLLNFDFALPSAVIVIIYASVILLNFWLGRTGVKQLPGGRLQFGSSWLPTFIVGIPAILLPIGVAELWRQSSYGFATFYAALLLAVAVSAVLGVPQTILIGSEGVQQHYWLRNDKFICWNEIVGIDSSRTTGITIHAADGTRIRQNMVLYSDPAQLLRALKQHCGHDLPTDFPHERLENS